MKLAVNSYNDMAHVMVSARVMGFSVNPRYDVSLHYGVSPCYDVFQLLTCVMVSACVIVFICYSFNC